MYIEQFMMLLAVFERAALMLMTLFLLTRTQLFQSIVSINSKENASKTR
ncbi:hypothetical protein [Photobacterium carnosum]|nr:hypothetical protein [Photobacterium carnosum]